MGRPLVSVVVPNYNHARFLERRVASVLEQTVQDLEIILLDDASTDNSTAILDSCRKDPRVRCHFNEANSGSPFAQWNRGIAMATGEFLWIAESDDDAEPRLLEGLLPLFQDGVDVAYCASRLMGEDGALFGTIPDPSRSPSQSRFAAPFCRSGTDELFDQLAAVCNEIPNASGVLFRLSALRAAGEADASYGLMGDWQYYARILLRGRVAFVPEAWNRFRATSHSARERHRKTGRRWRELCRFYDWARAQDAWTPQQRALFGARLAEYLISDMRLSRSFVGAPTTMKTLLKIARDHSWIRGPIAREIARQARARLRP